MINRKELIIIKRVLIYLLLVSFLNSCGLFELVGLRGEGAAYKIRNSSSYIIKIEAYKNNQNIDSFSLSQGGDTTSVENFRTSSRYGFFKVIPDSVVIIFNNERYIIQYCSGDALNLGKEECSSILKNVGAMYHRLPRKETAERIKGTRITEKYTIGFDDKDFERATPIEDFQN